MININNYNYKEIEKEVNILKSIVAIYKEIDDTAEYKLIKQALHKSLQLISQLIINKSLENTRKELATQVEDINFVFDKIYPPQSEIEKFQELQQTMDKFRPKSKPEEKYYFHNYNEDKLNA